MRLSHTVCYWICIKQCQFNYSGGWPFVHTTISCSCSHFNPHSCGSIHIHFHFITSWISDHLLPIPLIPFCPFLCSHLIHSKYRTKKYVAKCSPFAIFSLSLPQSHWFFILFPSFVCKRPKCVHLFVHSFVCYTIFGSFLKIHILPLWWKINILTVIQSFVTEWNTVKY